VRDKEEMGKGLNKDGEPCLFFSLGRETYAVRIQRLREIVTPEGMEPLPPADFKYSEGLSFRGNRIPVIRLSDFFEYPGGRDDPKSVLVMGGERQFGLLVNGVKGVWNIREAELKPLPQLATHLNPQYVRGIAKVGGRAVFLLNEDYLSQMGEVSSFYDS